MSQAADQILQAALALPEEEQEALIDALIAARQGPPHLSPAWMAEIERRSAEYDAGLVKAVPWKEVRERVNRELDQRG